VAKKAKEEVEANERSLTAAERVQRHAEIAEAVLRGLAVKQVARTYNVSERHVYRVMADYRSSQPKLRDINPVQVVEDRLMMLQAAAEEYALIAQTTTNETLRVNAITKRLDAYQQATELMQAAGVMPNNLGTINVAIDVKRVAQRIVNAVEEFGLGEEQTNKLLEVITGQVIDVGDDAVEEEITEAEEVVEALEEVESTE
jgi:acetolactate synthase small subunit